MNCSQNSLEKRVKWINLQPLERGKYLRIIKGLSCVKVFRLGKLNTVGTKRGSQYTYRYIDVRESIIPFFFYLEPFTSTDSNRRFIVWKEFCSLMQPFGSSFVFFMRFSNLEVTLKGGMCLMFPKFNTSDLVTECNKNFFMFCGLGRYSKCKVCTAIFGAYRPTGWCALLKAVIQQIP
jgi:hypothetical protein